MLQLGYWYEIKDGDPRAVGLYRRHYSCVNQDADHVRHGFSGQGESLILMLADCRALFGWRKQKESDDNQDGVNCFIFRNESSCLSSDLIKEADDLAWQRWEDKRHYTYINSKKIRSTNPGYCFIQAGWKRCGYSKGGLAILERVG